ncbi:MAG: hypothetical protein ABFS05_11005 [Bacteroidota bacterium]
MKIYPLLFFILSSLIVSGQTSSDSISMVRKNGSIKYFHQHKEVKFLELPGIMQDNPEAYKTVNYAKHAHAWGHIMLGLAGINLAYGVLIGLSEVVEHKAISYIPADAIAGIVLGTIFIAIYIPINSNYKEGTRRAIDIYNSGLQQSSRRKTDLRFGFNSCGIGMTLRF